MRTTVVVLLAFAVAAIPASAASQRRHRRYHRRSASSSRAAAAKAAAQKSSAEIRAARERLAAQIKILTHFLYLFGGVAKGIESADAEMRSGEASPVVGQRNSLNKAKVVESISDLKQGLNKLETDFSSRASLRNYYSYIIGVADLAETARKQASSGRFDPAGESLLKAVDRLTDALAAMRTPQGY